MSIIGTATLVNVLVDDQSSEYGNRYQASYMMEPPYLGNDFVVVSAINLAPRHDLHETYIFPSDGEDITDFGELEGSQDRVYGHRPVLTDIGYRIVREEA